MAQPAGDQKLWDIGEKIAEQGLLFAVLVAFITALAIRKIAWWWQIAERDARVVELKAQIAALDGKIDKLETENRAMLQIITTNTQTTAAAVDGFNRARADTVKLLEVLQELERRRDIDDRRRRTTHGG